MAIAFSSIECEPFGNIIVPMLNCGFVAPQLPSSDFYNMSNNKFSKNVAQINVKDPEVTDLSFVDLPGLPHDAYKCSRRMTI